MLIDEIDRSDAEFEAFLLEVLSDFQVSIPELGTIRAPSPPAVLLTSNNTRELSEALKRRCLYIFVDYPTSERELEVVQIKVPGLGDQLAKEAVQFVQKLRQMDLKKRPSVSETITARPSAGYTTTFGARSVRASWTARAVNTAT